MKLFKNILLSLLVTTTITASLFAMNPDLHPEWEQAQEKEESPSSSSSSSSSSHNYSSSSSLVEEHKLDGSDLDDLEIETIIKKVEKYSNSTSSPATQTTNIIPLPSEYFIQQKLPIKLQILLQELKTKNTDPKSAGYICKYLFLANRTLEIFTAMCMNPDKEADNSFYKELETIYEQMETLSEIIDDDLLDLVNQIDNEIEKNAPDQITIFTAIKTLSLTENLTNQIIKCKENELAFKTQLIELLKPINTFSTICSTSIPKMYMFISQIISSISDYTTKTELNNVEILLNLLRQQKENQRFLNLKSAQLIPESFWLQIKKDFNMEQNKKYFLLVSGVMENATKAMKNEEDKNLVEQLFLTQNSKSKDALAKIEELIEKLTNENRLLHNFFKRYNNYINKFTENYKNSVLFRQITREIYNHFLCIAPAQDQANLPNYIFITHDLKEPALCQQIKIAFESFAKQPPQPSNSQIAKNPLAEAISQQILNMELWANPENEFLTKTKQKIRTPKSFLTHIFSYYIKTLDVQIEGMQKEKEAATITTQASPETPQLNRKSPKIKKALKKRKTVKKNRQANQKTSSSANSYSSSSSSSTSSTSSTSSHIPEKHAQEQETSSEDYEEDYEYEASEKCKVSATSSSQAQKNFDFSEFEQEANEVEKITTNGYLLFNHQGRDGHATWILKLDSKQPNALQLADNIKTHKLDKMHDIPASAKDSCLKYGKHYQLSDRMNFDQINKINEELFYPIESHKLEKSNNPGVMIIPTVLQVGRKRELTLEEQANLFAEKISPQKYTPFFHYGYIIILYYEQSKSFFHMFFHETKDSKNAFRLNIEKCPAWRSHSKQRTSNPPSPASITPSPTTQHTTSSSSYSSTAKPLSQPLQSSQIYNPVSEGLSFSEAAKRVSPIQTPKRVSPTTTLSPQPSASYSSLSTTSVKLIPQGNTQQPPPPLPPPSST